MITFRAFTKQDAADYRGLRLRSLKEHPESFLFAYEEAVNWPLNRFEKAMERPWIGAFDDKTMIGFVGMMPNNSMKLKHKANVGPVYVTPEMRGKGIAKAMLQAIILKAQEMGIELLQLSANALHPEVVSLYKSVGFEPYGTEKHIMKLADGSYVDDILMEKFL
ncbi:MAG: GNAT family N-acetyltransferase [Alphaproteobacteria bacterium]